MTTKERGYGVEYLNRRHDELVLEVAALKERVANLEAAREHDAEYQARLEEAHEKRRAREKRWRDDELDELRGRLDRANY